MNVPVDEHGFYSGALDPARCAECAGAWWAGPCALHRDADPAEWRRLVDRARAADLVHGLRLWYWEMASTPVLGLEPGRQ